MKKKVNAKEEMKIGDRIKLLREERELNKAQLGRLVNVSDVTISYWESNEIKQIGHFSIIALCKALGCTANELLGIDDEE